MNKKWYGIISLFLCLLVLGACGTSENKSSSNADNKDSKEVSAEEKNDKKGKSQDLGDFVIELGGKVIEQDGKFVIEGQSNLIPGSRLVGELYVSEDEVFADTTELVQDDGSFTMELEHHQYGEAEIVVRFDFDNVQDDPVLRHYGDKGQKLEGPIIYKHEVFGDILKKAEVSVHYDPSNKSDLTFAVPEWNELPEDYGDPRVWIEVDEITEDKEFYYLQGRSNLLEGAEIKGSFGSNRDTAQIKPDGSFELKMEYEYLEDKDFVIEFDPLWQWNEIEEAYGSKGQKLVGDLVKTNKYNDNQTVEKVIPWNENE
ncbi:hypothetical protein [Oceanobacillus sp. Castelsardo]|uniref:hypothetical protein n=1 Tax=Oceanobacillus sp. Castelsardo TaxID=1851204 RepID=UPI000838B743|nr:hypothetical protein [Oceanobacillus sp. Castelsardo]